MLSEDRLMKSEYRIPRITAKEKRIQRFPVLGGFPHKGGNSAAPALPSEVGVFVGHGFNLIFSGKHIPSFPCNPC